MIFYFEANEKHGDENKKPVDFRIFWYLNQQNRMRQT